MPITGEYEPSPWDWVREQVEEYEASAGSRANTLRDTDLPIIVMTTRGHKSGKVRKVPVMRVEHEGNYAIVASKGGAPEHPEWYHNLIADPHVTIQDGPEPFEAEVRLATGDDRADWWRRSVEAYPPYSDYQEKTDREIPVFVTSQSA